MSTITSQSQSVSLSSSSPYTVASFLSHNAVWISATAASICSVTLGYPFDTVKVRMQAFKYPGLVDCVKRTYAAEGLLGFYRGVLPVLASTSLLRSISFSIYTSGKLGLLAETNDPSSFIHLPGLSDFQRTAVAASASGCFTGVVIAAINAPIEFIKIQKQLERINYNDAVPHSSPTTSTTTSASHAGRSKPPSHSIHTSSSSSSSPSSSSSSVTHSTSSKSSRSKSIHSHPGANPSISSAPIPKVSTTTTPLLALPASDISSLSSVPHQVKGGGGTIAAAAVTAAATSTTTTGSRNTTTGTSMLGWMRRIIAQKGVLGLYSGAHLHIARDGLGTAFFFGGYELMKIGFAKVIPSGESNSSRSTSTPSSSLSSETSSSSASVSPIVHLLAGGCAGSLCWLVLFPIDVIKSVIQRDALQLPHPKYKTARQFLGKAWKRGGLWRRMYAGIGAQLMRSFPIHAINFLVYEQVLLVCRGGNGGYGDGNNGGGI